MEINEKVIELVGQLLKVASDSTRLKIMFALLDDSKCHCKCHANGDCCKCQCLSCMIEKRVNDIASDISCVTISAVLFSFLKLQLIFVDLCIL